MKNRKNKLKTSYYNDVKDIIMIETEPRKESYCYSILKKCFPCFYFVYNVSSIYLFWIVTHYGASHLYTHVCVPQSTYGFLLSPVLASSPHCKAIRWAINNGGNTIDSMWLVIGTWICSKILIK